MVEIRNIRTFYYAATTLNFSEAAKQMNYTQPAVTLQIKKMEEEFGCELFKQVGKYKELTESGVIVFEAAKKILNILSSMEDDLKHSGKNETHVSIASDINFLKNHLLKKLEDIYLNDQDITVELNVVEDSTDILLGVQNKKYDIGVVHGKYEEWNMKCLEVQNDYHEVPVGDALKIDVEDYISLPYAVVIVNPNAPSGHYLPVKDIERLVKSDLNRLVIIDEAYIDYGGVSVAPLVKKYNNLLVVQTFSKSRNLAGARIGFVLGDASLIHDLNGVRGTTNPFMMSMIQEKIACASLDDNEYFSNCVQEVIAIRSYFTKELRRMGYTVLDSLTNFVLIQPRYITAEELYEGLKKQKILTRFYKMPRIEQYLRISIGTKEDMDKVLAAIQQIDVHQSKCIKI
ncbi:aminotransferase class I/II-fold pyridoxal phosphate-dependent enzyme [Niallia sp. 03190]|uniref:aminotransferase class I/II-fold pyridoxal phosphate-dependent enzyme n=2 Tax=Niallia TaxID=2837506 RepID=UPI004044AC11